MPQILYKTIIPITAMICLAEQPKDTLTRVHDPKAGFSNAKETVDSLVTITGYIEDSETGNGIEISVISSNDDYINYRISEKGKGRELKKQVGQLVKLTGSIQPGSGKMLTFTVNRFEKLNDLTPDSL